MLLGALDPEPSSRRCSKPDLRLPQQSTAVPAMIAYAMLSRKSLPSVTPDGELVFNPTDDRVEQRAQNADQDHGADGEIGVQLLLALQD